MVSTNLFLKLVCGGRKHELLVDFFILCLTGLVSVILAYLWPWLRPWLWIATSPLRDSNVLMNISLESKFMFLEICKLWFKFLFFAGMFVLESCSEVISSSKFSLPCEINWFVEDTLQLSTTMYLDHYSQSGSPRSSRSGPKICLRSIWLKCAPVTGQKYFSLSC
jgi:hypothetical protein